MSAVAARTAQAPTASAPSPLLRGWRFEVLIALAGAATVVIGTRAAGQVLTVVVIAFAAVLCAAGIGRSAADRRVIALGGVLTLLIAIPINRVSGATDVIVAVMASCIALTVVALLRSPAPLPRGWMLVLGLTVSAAFVTVLAPDGAGLLRFAPYLVSFVPSYVLFGQAGPAEQHRVMRVLIFIAVLEGVYATVEPFVHTAQLWAPTEINNLGVGVSLPNPFFPSLARSQATLGHPLPLGILLVTALAVLIRGLELGRASKVLLAVPMLTGLIMSGSRNSLVIAVLVVAYFTPTSLRFIRWCVTTLVLGFFAVLAVAAGLLTADVTNEIGASGSVTHRSGAIEAAVRLLSEQDLLHVLVGNGWASTARLFSEGLLQTDGFGAVDDEFVLLLAQGGLVCLVLLVVLLVLGVSGARRSYRPAVFAVVLTLAVFDLLIWPSSAAVFGMLLAAGAQRAGSAGSSSRAQ